MVKTMDRRLSTGKKIKYKNLLFLDDALFTLQSNVNRESNEYWCYKNLHTFCKVSFTSS